MLSVSASDKARCIVKASQSSRDITIVGDTPDLTSAFSVSNVELLYRVGPGVLCLRARV